VRKMLKFELEGARRQRIKMPAGAAILSVGLQGSAVCLWAMVDPAAADEWRAVESYGTDHDIDSPEGLRFIGTTADASGSPPVLHHFERRARRTTRTAGALEGLGS
jgi:hypothetical protein